MSLLTEEQIQDLYLQLDNVSSTSAMQKVIQEWNEKQTTQQIEVGWSNAPDCAVGAALNLAWLTENGNWALGYQIAKYDRPAPVITPHPHAALMTKYAEVAARCIHPWVEFEYTCATNNWLRLNDHPAWDESVKYRHIGDNK